MLKSMFRMTVLGFICTAILFTSCETEAVTSELESQNYVNASLSELQDQAKSGKAWCFEFVYPISISFEDGTQADVADLTELKSTLHSYVEENGRDAERPSFVFPLEVLSEDGELLSVADREELKSLTASCVREGFRNRVKRFLRKGQGRKGLECYSLVFPVTIVFSDESTATVADREEARVAKQAFREANPDVSGRAMLQFPIRVTLEDESVVEVADREALKALKESCIADEQGDD